MTRSRFMATLRWIAAFIIGSLILQIKMDYLESYLYDLRMSFTPKPAASSMIELVYVDKTTVEELKHLPQAKHYNALLEKLLQEKPRSIVFLPNPLEIKGTDAEVQAFADTLASSSSVFYVTNELELKGEEGKLNLPHPFDKVQVFSGPITTDSTVLAKDGVTRRLMLDYEGKLMLHPYLAAKVIPERANPKNLKGVFDFYETNQIYAHLLPAHSYSKSSMIDVINEKALGRFKDKFVFIGVDLEQTTKDYIQTPYSRDVTAMTKTEAHANLLDSVLRNDGMIIAPKWVNYFFTIIISILTITIVMTLKPSKGLILMGSALIGYSVFSYIAFWLFSLWIDVSHPFLAIFICYYFFIPYRLIIENRTSWEYQQKNKLLTQVEELKTNFISMMSHDLKTPLARIQGMAEILERNNSLQSADEKRALKTIKSSSDDLVHFITSILEFSRIESQGVKLNLVSKDINALITDEIAKHEYMAKNKNISIRSELEPLFSIKLDPVLIRQVISNLIENAIKYSPEDSKILVTSEENNGKILVQVSDQGPGIPPEEIDSIFMKFYRSSTAKSSTVAGSGLGLYLSKYFTELHHGKLTVESELGQGSTFSIEIGDQA